METRDFVLDPVVGCGHTHLGAPAAGIWIIPYCHWRSADVFQKYKIFWRSNGGGEFSESFCSKSGVPGNASSLLSPCSCMGSACTCELLHLLSLSRLSQNICAAGPKSGGATQIVKYRWSRVADPSATVGLPVIRNSAVDRCRIHHHLGLCEHVYGSVLNRKCSFRQASTYSTYAHYLLSPYGSWFLVSNHHSNRLCVPGIQM